MICVDHKSSIFGIRPYLYNVLTMCLMHFTTFSGYLRGLDVIGETSFIVFTNQAQTFHWVGYGLKVHIPQEALPPDVEKCRILIKVGLSGKFALPPDLSLMSAIYWLDTEPRCKFSKSITLEVQHCTSPTQSSQLSFVVARCSQKELPYSFKILHGGVFRSHTSFGSIQLNHFSFIAVTGNGEPQYCARLYYTGNNQTTRKAHFVITKNFEACVTVSSTLATLFPTSHNTSFNGKSWGWEQVMARL